MERDIYQRFEHYGLRQIVESAGVIPITDKQQLGPDARQVLYDLEEQEGYSVVPFIPPEGSVPAKPEIHLPDIPAEPKESFWARIGYACDRATLRFFPASRRLAQKKSAEQERNASLARQYHAYLERTLGPLIAFRDQWKEQYEHLYGFRELLSRRLLIVWEIYESREIEIERLLQEQRDIGQDLESPEVREQFSSLMGESRLPAVNGEFRLRRQGIERQIAGCTREIEYVTKIVAPYGAKRQEILEDLHRIERLISIAQERIMSTIQEIEYYTNITIPLSIVTQGLSQFSESEGMVSRAASLREKVEHAARDTLDVFLESYEE
ncbi:hypothetical protein J4460_07910 [Candidatus Woesearchaeota archaeon]|nr:hypothetical protein [Candidatus Woesearchaeota archaeon]HIH38334.1 hypothetical protein [Candidatus Woesearchaeota archaeon]HIH48242.1 hypothetical protein [Candidatus Woesearchaeota archaeon]HIJ03274.1 hypothetical protein [Candidatus Woesearchaeota archaeon]